MATFADIPCCLCGVPIQPNPANMCATCLNAEVDFTDDISPSGDDVPACRSCGAYQGVRGKGVWLHCEPESRELLALCLRKVPGLAKKGAPKLVDASFVWREPHSRRIETKLTLEKEFKGATCRKTIRVVHVVRNQQCPDCKAETSQQKTPLATVQVRQRAGHKRTLLALDQAIAKQRKGLLLSSLDVRECAGGFDVSFAARNDALRFADFVCSVVPARKLKESKHLVGSDKKSNKFRFDVSLSLEVVPLNRHDLVLLPQNLFGEGLNRLCVVSSVARAVHLVEAKSAWVADLHASRYFRFPFTAIASHDSLVSFTCFDVVPVVCEGGPEEDRAKWVLADVDVARTDEIESNGELEMLSLRTHLGAILKVGDEVQGYDLRSTTAHSGDVDGFAFPAVVLVQKAKAKRDSGAR